MKKVLITGAGGFVGSYLIKEFKAPPKDANGNCEAAKRELRKYVPDAFAPPKENPIRCPRCGILFPRHSL